MAFISKTSPVINNLNKIIAESERLLKKTNLTDPKAGIVAKEIEHQLHQLRKTRNTITKSNSSSRSVKTALESLETNLHLSKNLPKAILQDPEANPLNKLFTDITKTPFSTWIDNQPISDISNSQTQTTDSTETSTSTPQSTETEQLEQIKKYYTPPKTNEGLVHPDKTVPTYEQEIKKEQQSAVIEAEKIIQESQKNAPDTSKKIGEEQATPLIKQPKRTRKASGKPLPIIGEQRTNLPSPKIIIPGIRQGTKKDILTPNKEQLKLPTQKELEQITALPEFIARRLTKSQQNKRQTQTTEASARIQQITNFNPVRKVIHNIGAKTKINGIVHKTKQAFKNSKLNKSMHKVGNKAKNKAKSLLKKGVGKLTKKLALKAGTILAGAATGIGLVLGAVGAIIGIGKFIAKHKEIAFAVGSWLMLKFAALLSNAIAIAGAITGAITGAILGFTIGMAIGGPLGAIAGTVIGAGVGFIGGGIIGNTIYNAIQSHGGVGNLTQNAIYGSPVPTINPITGGLGGITRIGGAADLVTGYASPTLVPAGLIGIPLFSTLGIATFLTFFVMIVILTAFTVPNPLGVPTAAVLGEDLQCEPNQPDSTALWSDMQTAAAKACIPVDILSAIMQTESGAYGLTDEQYQFFSENNWWNTKATDGNGNTVDCFQGHYGPRDFPNSTCRTGYCYDTCTETGLCGGQYEGSECPASGTCSMIGISPITLQCPWDSNTNNYIKQCTRRDVMGIMQFRRTTFHGSNCGARDGNGPNCTSGSGGTGNRCNAQNSVFASAQYIANRLGISCPYNPNQWNLAKFCQAAKTYCGSCGTVERTVTPEIYKANPEKYPCYPFYGNSGDPSGACTGINNNGETEGYCDKAYRLANCTIN